MTDPIIAAYKKVQYITLLQEARRRAPEIFSKYSAKPIGREESTVEYFPEVPAQRVQPDILDR